MSNTVRVRVLKTHTVYMDADKGDTMTGDVVLVEAGQVCDMDIMTGIIEDLGCGYDSVELAEGDFEVIDERAEFNLDCRDAARLAGELAEAAVAVALRGESMLVECGMDHGPDVRLRVLPPIRGEDSQC
jgi:hypothetical protein